ncbi:MAG: rhodanese-like domain-containing protein, partial [Bacillota bacterium]|nr:rhodanese-like domain-containing protein [Bacillota bacterium]
GVTVVDVRTPEEYEEEHITAAILVPVESIRDEAPSMLPDKEANLLVYCRTGVRSEQAAKELVALGYNNVYDFGGIVDWTYGTEGGDNLEQ